MQISRWHAALMPSGTEEDALPRQENLFRVEPSNLPDALHEVPHDKHENYENGHSDGNETPEGEFSHSIIILATGFQLIVKVDVPEKMLGEKKVRQSAHEKRRREEDGADKQKLPVFAF